MAEVEKNPNHPLKIVYCARCGLPPEYCEWGPNDLKECRKWLVDNEPELATDLGLGEAGEKLENLQVEEGGKKSKRGGKALKKAKQAGEAPVGGDVTIKSEKRKGKKYTTTVTGLAGYGIDLKAASKTFAQKMAASASVDKENIQIQGDCADEIMELILEKFPQVPEANVTVG
eukprot:Clim_evm6s66 gene=Clim_evmTU6s66